MRQFNMAAMAVLTFASLTLGGCGFTSYGDLARDLASEKGAQAMDEGLVNAEWFLCKGASVGAVQRRYGQNSAKADAWKELCLDSGDVISVPTS